MSNNIATQAAAEKCLQWMQPTVHLIIAITCLWCWFKSSMHLSVSLCAVDFSWFVSDNVLCDNSQLSLNRQLYRMDTSVKWPPRFGPSLYLLTLYLTL